MTAEHNVTGLIVPRSDDDQFEPFPVYPVQPEPPVTNKFKTVAPRTTLSTTGRTKPKTTVSTYTTRAYQKFTSTSPKSEISCGQPIPYVDGYILGGKASYQGQWPWLAAFYESNINGGLKFICGGTLISRMHVVK